MRNISCSLTEPQVVAGTKDITRRLGWEFIKPGDHLMFCRKCMGRKPGEDLVRIREIEVVSVRREPLCALTNDLDYGFQETTREGFPEGTNNHWPTEFVDFFCRTHKGCTPETTITRIEFRYV